MQHIGDIPAGLARSLQAAEALAALLICTDQAAWGSLARPPVAGVGVLMRKLHDDISAEVEAMAADMMAAARPPG